MHRLQTGRLARSTAVAAGMLACLGAAPATQPASYTASIVEWRAQREARLKAPGGWLSVAGLFWLEEGTSRFGADPNLEIALPEGAAPPLAGRFEREGGRVVVTVEPGVAVTASGSPVTTMVLRDDSTGSPDVLELGRLTMHVIKRGERYAIRLKDAESPYRREFSGLHWYDVDPSWRIEARFVPYDPPRSVRVPNILGTVDDSICPGYAEFRVGGETIRLEPILEAGEDELFFIFKDATSGARTYPAGRFLYASMPTEGIVVLDFNKAYNPPCAFTPYATCPLPPDQNKLSIRIEAGELNYGHH